MSAESQSPDHHAAAGDDLDKIAALAGAPMESPGADRVPIGNVMSWVSSGPVAQRFVWHPAPVSLICGPFGSGKTTAMFVKLLICSMAVPPSPVDDVRYARVAVVRDTYRNLETNTIPSWEERFPKSMGKWKGGGGGEPGMHVIDFLLEDGTTLHWEVLFVAVGDHNVKQFCDGLQLTACALNGTDELPGDLIDYMQPRLGRWPAPQHRPPDWKRYVPFWCKLMGDMNAPDLDNWTYDKFVENKSPDFEIFMQPGGLDEGAENLANLRDGYYERMMHGKADWWIKRFVHNKFGFSRSGTPVYPDFNDALHVSSRPLAYDKRRVLVFGGDGGRDCCVIAMQRTFAGRVHWLKEFVPEKRMGAKQFGAWLAREAANTWPEIEKFVFFLDPACFEPNSEDDDFTWAEIFARAFGLGEDWRDYVKPAQSQDPEVRRDAVASLLREFDDGQPLLLIDPVNCRTVRRGFASGFHYANTKTHGEETKTLDPVKNKYSHPMEAGEYGTLGSSNVRLLVGRKPFGGGRRVHEEPAGHDPLYGDR